MNKKGFTLVELLAVIAILALLVIIALPNILRIFKNAKQNTFVTEVQNLVRSAEDKYLTSSMNNGSNNTCFDSKTNKLDMTGRDNLIYKIKLTNKGKIINIEVLDNNYYINVSNEEGIKIDSITSNEVKTRNNTQTLLDCNGESIVEGITYGLPLIIFEGSTPDKGYIKDGKLYKEDIKTEIEKIEVPTKEGYIFKGYNIPGSETQIIDKDGNILKENLNQIEESITLESKWEKGKYVDSELNGADPVLKDPMIPIMLSDTGVATYADIYKDEWYSYKDKKWANAVILVDTPSKEYVAGEEILESDIRAYFVWIPKYSYRIFNMGEYDKYESVQPESQAKEIEIEFGTRTTTNDDVKKECASPMESGAKGDCDIGDLMTHPAFLSIPSNGFWVGKFETGYNQNKNTDLPITDENISTWTKAFIDDSNNVNKTSPNNIIIKPNVYAWRKTNVYNLFMSAYNFNRNLDSHMMKNTEWGAVAYLSHSKYGIKDEVRINNHNKFLTGYAAKEKDAVGSATENTPWNTTNGYTASTTGNITGVYDMSGGAWEYMASYKIGGDLTKSEMETIVNNSEYIKYLDTYSSSSFDKSYKYRILGDATGELGPFYYKDIYRSTWYDDHALFVFSSAPWFHRGGGYTEKSLDGQFDFNAYSGGASDNSIRIVLKIDSKS